VDGTDEIEILKNHGEKALAQYLKVQSFYADLASVVARIIEESITSRLIKIHSVQSRHKSAESFLNKAATPADDNPNRPKYHDPMIDITDLAGVRIITHFLSTLTDIDQMLATEFEILEKSNKGTFLVQSDRFGYQSIHYLLRFKPARAALPEYRRYAGHTVEVQVRTILQHAWAEIEHDIQYKSSTTIPTEIRRRFVALAGMLEIGDREFQAISDANKALEQAAQTKVEAGNLTGVEITPNALKFFLDKKLGPDGRQSSWSYDYTTRLLKALGFRDLGEVEKAIEPYDDHRLSIIHSRSRQGQVSRFEIMLQAALGEEWQKRHPSQNEFLQEYMKNGLERLQNGGIDTGTYTLNRPAAKMQW
jgi:ppGpp synthetase/RelA/SpoT-type nucleotidyltranferase